MNKFKKVLAVVVAVMLFAALAMTVAAATGNKTVYAGESVTVTFTYKDSYSLDGLFKVDDPNGIIEGATVRAGQQIASVGSTAMVEIAEEPHLHFEMTVGGLAVDPLEYFSSNDVATLQKDTAYEQSASTDK